jgi:hypothetical protein
MSPPLEMVNPTAGCVGCVDTVSSSLPPASWRSGPSGSSGRSFPPQPGSCDNVQTGRSFAAERERTDGAAGPAGGRWGNLREQIWKPCLRLIFSSGTRTHRAVGHTRVTYGDPLCSRRGRARTKTTMQATDFAKNNRQAIECNGARHAFCPPHWHLANLAAVG